MPMLPNLFVKVELLCCSRTEIGTLVKLCEPVSYLRIRKHLFSVKQVYDEPIVVPGTLLVFLILIRVDVIKLEL